MLLDSNEMLFNRKILLIFENPLYYIIP